MASAKFLRSSHLHIHGGFTSALPAIPPFSHNRLTSLDQVYFSTNWSLPPLCAVSKIGFSATKDEAASSGDIEFEAPLKIVQYPDPKLRAKNKRIVSFDDNLKSLAREMFDVMYKEQKMLLEHQSQPQKSTTSIRTDGIGLSAPQVGINVQLMVFNPVGEPGEGEEIVLVNPRVSKYSKKLSIFNEGCLSFPGIYADVKRPESVKIDARDVNGNRFSFSLDGLPARVFQHEFDHLQGILFFERMTEEVLGNIREQLQALEMKYEQLTGVPSPEKIQNRRERRNAVGFGKS
ncbi:peptide deformylase 1B, chloroplastic/mitochondrial-like isoform X1 [Arachis stenosperma]|uniref:peptide deformylase 1B, chloroplastic/mitochondrial-like isoform X1 n=1 Tax=Arachis stenosperma TaxID=217475 RepID=UPI0025AC56C5|nr:peptide deformylase 1B, chloroplastic/mitochondrial-like isoform X1 [Arachis stenosperma]XP_057756723.1 peptide deformylase 1B, chloroplastic/mitochondrial-like isoform X1 [Arachis stenosperma]XP_057756724.1 peptide deformylase 1B, chloroplastic/mitochondrial-like isoform X1 [Arachis stenosperma]XP_057756725.1 peptide deformylase 1B, chloroplastic/mitochondrial-like isoform X1 [Arachis stenosperma]